MVAFAILLGALAAVPAAADQAGAGSFGWRLACALWSRDRVESAGACAYIGVYRWSGGERPFAYSWSWHQSADGSVDERTGTPAEGDARIDPLASSAEVATDIDGCAVRLHLSARDPNPLARATVRPLFGFDEQHSRLYVVAEATFAGEAVGTGTVCDDPLARGEVTEALIGSGEWPFAFVGSVPEVGVDRDAVRSLLRSR